MIIGKYKKIELEPFEIQFIKDNYKCMTNRELAQTLGLKLTFLRTNLYSLGLKRMELEYWTEEQKGFLLDNYKDIGDVELAEIFNNEWPKNKDWTKKHIEKKRKYLNLKRSVQELKIIHGRNKENGRFNSLNQRWKVHEPSPIGEIKIWHNGNRAFTVVKTEKGFVHRNRWMWIQEYGDIPSNEYIVAKEGSPIICTIDQLEKISLAEHARRNVERNMRYPEELRLAIRTVNKINKKLKSNES